MSSSPSSSSGPRILLPAKAGGAAILDMDVDMSPPNSPTASSSAAAAAAAAAAYCSPPQSNSSSSSSSSSSDVPAPTPSKLSLDRRELQALVLSREEELARQWIESVTGESLPSGSSSSSSGLCESLQDGQILCRLMNALCVERGRPAAIGTILSEQSTQIEFLRAYENISRFLTACKTHFGMVDADLFEWMDLAKAQNFRQVVHCLCHLRSIVLGKAGPAQAASPASDELQDTSVDSTTGETDDDPDGDVSMTEADENQEERFLREYREQRARALKKTEAQAQSSGIAGAVPRGKNVSNAKYLLRKVIGNPVRRVNKTFKAFTKGIQSVLADMAEDMSTTAAQIVEATQRHEAGQADLQQKYVQEQTLRKRYLNQVIELQGNIRVYCRMRPLLGAERKGSSCIDPMDDASLVITQPNARNPATAGKPFKFDRVFTGESTQEQVFEDVAPFVQSALDGYNVCIFAYGQTGSGKTFTMEGTPENPGVNNRALTELFKIIDARKATFEYEISMNVVEIYNEQPRDLLVEPRKYKKQVNKTLDIRQGKEGVYIPDLTEIPVGKPSDVWEMMRSRAYANRSVSATAMNAQSSRSHSLLFINVTGRNKLTEDTSQGKLIMVDLAGSERVKRSEAQGDRFKEATFINKSLSALGNVVCALQQKKRGAHIPYRDSKLTYLLQQCLGGHSKCLMFCNLSPADSNYQESLCSLQFAQRVAKVQLGQAKKSVQSGNLVKYKTMIARTKEELMEQSEKMEAMQAQMQEHASQISERDAEIAALKRQLAEQKDRIEDLQGDKEDLQKRVKAMSSEASNLQASLEKEREQAERERKRRARAPVHKRKATDDGAVEEAARAGKSARRTRSTAKEEMRAGAASSSNSSSDASNTTTAAADDDVDMADASSTSVPGYLKPTTSSRFRRRRELRRASTLSSGAASAASEGTTDTSSRAARLRAWRARRKGSNVLTRSRSATVPNDENHNADAPDEESRPEEVKPTRFSTRSYTTRSRSKSRRRMLSERTSTADSGATDASGSWNKY